MNSSGTDGIDTPRCACPDWLTRDEAAGGVVTLRIRGGIAATRADELWNAIESALECSAGSRVIVDASGVTGFDADSVRVFVEEARAAVRRRSDLCVVARPLSAFGQYLRFLDAGGALSLYPSLAAALDSPARDRARMIWFGD